MHPSAAPTRAALPSAPPSPPSPLARAGDAAPGQSAPAAVRLPPSLDGPLPAELTGRFAGPLTGYRRWPVFSRTWVLRRLAVVGGVVLLVLLPLYAAALGDAPAEGPWSGVASLTVELLLPLLIGPFLGWQVRCRGWPERREGLALAGAVALAVASVFLWQGVAAEPFKQWVAERTGAVDAQGKRKRVVVTLGVTVSKPPQPGAAPEPALAPPELRGNFGHWATNLLARGFVAFVLAGGLALMTWRRELDGLRALEREAALRQAQARQREAELRLSVLAAQVEPHFLFNTLAGVRSAIATDPARASTMIDQLVDYLRAAIPRLRGDGAVQATVGAQFELVEAYLRLMRSRMPRLQVEVHLPEALRRARCPPLMLISLAENAVRHGVEPKIGPARIALRAEVAADGRLALVVEDDGIGFGQAQAGGGLGLTNIRERLAQLHGDAASLTLRARPEGGVRATLTLPLQTLEDA